MSRDEQPGGSGSLAAGMAPMFALFASAMSGNWTTLSKLGGFPRTGKEPETPTAAWPDLAGMQMQAMASSWKLFGDAMQGAFDAASKGQEGMAEQASRAMATTLRSFTGLDQNDMLAGAGRDWSPKQVAFRSFGVGDEDAVALSADLVHLASGVGETARAAMNLCRIVSDAWLRAGQEFSRRFPERDEASSDPVELQRAWASTVEPILQDALRSGAFVEGQAAFIRASSRQAKARSALARRFADFIEVPHRQEMNETYEAIQELRREVRILRRRQRQLEEALDKPSGTAPLDAG